MLLEAVNEWKRVSCATSFFSQEMETEMTRREQREQIFKMLFRVEFHAPAELPEQLKLFEEMDKPACSEKETAYIGGKYRSIVDHLADIDASINEVAEGWKTARMGKVDLTLLRLAVYEMRYEEDVPVKVAINEAVELAKKYGTDDSPSFVNGVLAKLA